MAVQEMLDQGAAFGLSDVVEGSPDGRGGELHVPLEFPVCGRMMERGQRSVYRPE
jgi:hypothetical protein